MGETNFSKKIRPLLLSPAGTPEALIAAVENGADEIYLGLPDFNARQSAENFTLERLSELTKYAHTRGVKIHVTLNTLLRDNELARCKNLALEADKIGVDAFIVQDLALARLLYGKITAKLHASTQLTCYNKQGVRALADLGFSRVVLARELNFDDIKEITAENIAEIEVFCHGALCINYSGQCLLSYSQGHLRSGNRGTCQQPCRLKFALSDNNFSHRLSPADLCSLEYVDEFAKAGVTALKIEGRLKSPEYVAAVTSAYRFAIDSSDKLFEKELCSDNAGDKSSKKELSSDYPQDKSAVQQDFSENSGDKPSKKELYSDNPQDKSAGKQDFSENLQAQIAEKKNELSVVFSRGGFCSGHQLKKLSPSDITYSYAGRTGLPLGKTAGRAVLIPRAKVQTFKVAIAFADKKAANEACGVKGLRVSDGISFLGFPDFGGIINAVERGRNFGEVVVTVCGRPPQKALEGGGLLVYKTYDALLDKRLKLTISQTANLKKISINSKFILSSETGAKLILTDNDSHIATSEIQAKPLQSGDLPEVTTVEKATDAKAPEATKDIDREALEKTIKATGGTPFIVENVKFDIEPGAFITFSEVKKMRREAVAKLLLLREERI